MIYSKNINKILQNISEDNYLEYSNGNDSELCIDSAPVKLGCISWEVNQNLYYGFRKKSSDVVKNE